MNGTMEQWYRRIYLAPPDDAGGGGGGDAVDSGTATETSSEPSSQPSGQGRGTAPWDKELQELGLNDPRFSEYTRTKQQPRMTQLEQQYAQLQGLIPQEVASQFDTPTGAYEAAANLMQGLNTDPAGTIQRLVELFQLDPQAVFQLQQAAGNDPEAQQAVEVAAQEAQQTPQLADDPRLQWAEQQMQAQIEQQQEQAYEAHLQDLASKIQGFNPKYYTHALVLSQGDPNLALEMYRNDYHDLVASATAEPPSPTLGQAAGVAPTEAPQHKSLKDAISAHFAEQRQLSKSVG